MTAELARAMPKLRAWDTSLSIVVSGRGSSKRVRVVRGVRECIAEARTIEGALHAFRALPERVKRGKP